MFLRILSFHYKKLIDYEWTEDDDTEVHYSPERDT